MSSLRDAVAKISWLACIGLTKSETLVSQCSHDHAPSGLSGGLPNQLGFG